MTDSLISRWQLLLDNFVDAFLQLGSSPLNLVLGPVFDNDFDSHFDNYTLFDRDSVPVPSHYYLLATRCLSGESTFEACPTENLDSVGLIYPMFEDVPNCIVSLVIYSNV